MRKPKYDDKIIKLLKKYDRLTVLAIAKQLGNVRPTTIYKVLTRMVDRSQVVKIGTTYSLTDSRPVEYTVVAGDGSESLAEPQITKVKKIPKISSMDAWRVVAKELSGEISSIEVSINDLTIQKQSLQQIHNRLSSIFGNAS